MTMTLIGRVLAGALAVLASLTLLGAAAARDFASTQPTSRGFRAGCTAAASGTSRSVAPCVRGEGNLLQGVRHWDS